MKPPIPFSKPRATTDKQGQVFLAAHNDTTPGAAVQADDPRLVGGGGGVTDHGALTGLTDDDHTQYQLESEKGAANGYASLDGSTLLPLTQLPAHASTHQSGGSDAIKLDDLAAPDDNTDLDGSSTKHGLMPKITGSSGQVAATDGTGIVWRWMSGALGAAIGGVAQNGNLSLGSSTVTISDYSVKAYGALDVGTGALIFQVSGNDSPLAVLYATTITGAGGTITRAKSAVTWRSSAQATGVASSAGGAAGGAGPANCALSLWVYSREISGSGTIRVLSDDGNTPANATVATGTGNGTTANGANQVSRVLGGNSTAFSSGALQHAGGGQSNGTGGLAGHVSTCVNISNMLDTLYDIAFWLSPKGPAGYNVTTLNHDKGRWCSSRMGNGGASGGRNNGGSQGAGGGGGGTGALNWITDTASPGGAGGAGGAGGSGSGGGGGGSGSAGGVLFVWAMSIASGWTITAPGGDGAAGSNGFGYGGGGGGGAAGPGGIVYCITTIATSATITAPAGAVGTGGNPGADGGSAGSDAPPGEGGLVMKLVMAA